MDRERLIVFLLALAAGASCRSAPSERTVPIVQPGAPGKPGRVITAGEAADLSQIRYTATDIRFMQGMIGHHLQALEMTALVVTRTANEDLRLLANRIEISQADEIEMLRGWLKALGEAVPDAHAHHATDAVLMPGMLTAGEMQRLAAAKGAEFDRLFLEFMIKHHDGALVMVDELFSSAGAGQQSDIFAFASDVEADQRMEIQRMSAMLKDYQK